MNGLKSFNIPIKVAKQGVHEYHFDVDDDFFENFEYSPIKNGEFKVMVTLNKKPNLLDLFFNISGKIGAPCDRCLAPIKLDIGGEKRILVKYNEFGKEDEDEVIYISEEETQLNVAKLIYEFIVLSIPMSKTIDCDANNFEFCDQKVLEYYENKEEPEEEQEEESPRGRLWDQLKDIKFN